MVMVVGIGSVEPTHGCKPFSGYVCFPPRCASLDSQNGRTTAADNDNHTTTSTTTTTTTTTTTNINNINDNDNNNDHLFR